MFELFEIVSFVGGTKSMMCIFFVLALVLWLYKKYKEAVLVVAALSVSAGVTYVLKHVFEVPRPLTALVLEDGYRFPSGHATSAAVVMMLGIYFSRFVKNKILRSIYLAVSASWFLVICWARLFLGVHYLVDVLVGGLIGTSVTLGVIYVLYRCAWKIQQ